MAIGIIAFILVVVYVIIECLTHVDDPIFNTRYWKWYLVICVIAAIIAIGFYYKEFLAILS
ncbi:Uncharacterised protein [Moraxella lacunata]|uniref:Uncharacterized protein n=1 Tax=Moraxella lacunata TaxID=477 RepID=A0A378TTE8_MORLA|nr:hypothetical protein [Moraxella lacunata]STZ64007.1 Uncharacterised protein [Moraxella lacunata]